MSVLQILGFTSHRGPTWIEESSGHVQFVFGWIGRPRSNSSLLVIIATFTISSLPLRGDQAFALEIIMPEVFTEIEDQVLLRFDPESIVS
jgi:hypothetical protein